MLRFKILASVFPLLAAVLLAHGGAGPASHPCIAYGETLVALTTESPAADLQVGFTDDPARATVRVQIIDAPEQADFAFVDDGTSAEADACQANPALRLVAIAAQPAGAGPIIHLSREGPADYRIYVRSRTFSPRDAAALIVGAAGGHPHLQAASL